MTRTRPAADISAARPEDWGKCQKSDLCRRSWRNRQRSQTSPHDWAVRQCEIKPKEGLMDIEAETLKRKKYERKLKDLHIELVKLQEWVKHSGTKICIVFEGRDGAGKGGVIKAITERVSPRVFRVYALPPPTEREKTQMFAQRYM